LASEVNGWPRFRGSWLRKIEKNKLVVCQHRTRSAPEKIVRAIRGGLTGRMRLGGSAADLGKSQNNLAKDMV
jgi:hypothetical protein